MSNLSPIACDMTALDEAEREAHEAVSEAVFDQVSALRELSDGYALRLPAETEAIQKAGAFVSRERLCCPFFQFSVEVSSEHGPVWLEMTGRKGVKAFIEETVLPYWDFASSDEDDPSDD
jgi:hypothetical protein